MAPTPKQTPLTVRELIRIWTSAMVDPAYSDPLAAALERLESGASIESSTDDAPGLEPGLDTPNGGYEVFTQSMAQAKRTSEAVVRTLESMYLLPWSGQVDDPAAGPQQATVTLAFSRGDAFLRECTLLEGQIWAEEVQTDASTDGGLTVRTERRYVLLDRVVFLPGERGPKYVQAVAEKVGAGYNNPLPGTITGIVQKGAGLQNDGATVAPGVLNHKLTVMVEPDVVVPEHVGQYVQFSGGANQGRFARVIGYQPPTTGNGGALLLARTAVFALGGGAGTFQAGERVQQATTGAVGVLSAAGGGYAVVEDADDLWAAGYTMTGVSSGATASVDIVEQAGGMVADVGTAVWRVPTWAELGITVTNEEQPVGGRHDMLDELGRERRMARAPGETDDVFRERVAGLPDTISPNAILRAANRVLAPYGAQATLREVGSAQLPGLFCDVDAMDYDPSITPSTRWKVQLDYASFRGFFLLGVPRLNVGEFGFAYDAGAYGAYDASPFLAFYDGLPLTAAVVYHNVWTAVNGARAAGVGFELFIEDGS